VINVPNSSNAPQPITSAPDTPSAAVGPNKPPRTPRRSQPVTTGKSRATPKGTSKALNNGTRHSPAWNGDMLKAGPKSEDEDLDITKGARTRNIYNRAIYREQAAENIARWLIIAFMFALGCAFLIMIILIIPIYWSTTETMTDKFMPSMPHVLEIVKIIGGIFSPLLAFILGYYFSISTQNAEKSDDHR
jgi:hypothetical protein